MKHMEGWKRPRNWSAVRGQGQGVKFLRTLLESAPPDCVIWPMFRDPNGYGRVGLNRKVLWSHRLMCEMAHGPAPSPNHEATHSCGNGHGGCVNPRHLMWGTRSRNQLDRRSHGTKAYGGWKHHPKLTAVDAIQIKKYDGPLTQAKLAKIFGVTDATIRDVRSGKSWKRLAA